MDALSFLPNPIVFSDGSSYKLQNPITDFRQCHGTEPAESRILYHCRCIKPPTSPASQPNQDSSYILKLKVQISDPTTSNRSVPQPGPSPTTSHELEALRLFGEAQTPAGPNLVAFASFPQPAEGLLPGGYVNCTVMSVLPGKSLFELGYWSLEAEKREVVREAFVEALGAVRKLGVEPGDKGLRNVMWDAASGRCGLVDFELWESFSPEMEVGRTEELQKWGLAHKPPAKNWWAEFGIHTC